MSRRPLTATLVFLLALWGVGLPRFAHVMTAHAPAADRERASICTAKCCSHHAHACDNSYGEQPSEGEESHHCPICELLATLLTNVPALPAVTLASRPAVSLVAPPPAAPVLSAPFELLAPRGPPAHS